MKKYFAVGTLFGLTSVFGCDAAKLRLEPASAVNIDVRPRSGQRLFCPGDPFQVEVVAKLKDGSSCSNVDDARGCAGKRGAVIDPELVRLEGSAGTLGGDFVWSPPADPLATAATGLRLTAWLEGSGESGAYGKSMVGEVTLAPVYDCMLERVFPAPPNLGGPGAPGAPGPDVTIVVTTLSTPYFSNAALIMLDVGGQRSILISPSADRPVRIVTAGQEGAPGQFGAQGTDGAPGAAAASKTKCARGAQGGAGTDGQPGGPGGAGGRASRVVVRLDEAAADALRGRIIIDNRPGHGGPGGMGGPGGSGGPGGAGGPSGIDCVITSGDTGPHGKDGAQGPNGANGAASPPLYETASRSRLFGSMLGVIRAIEATKAR